MNQVTLFGFCGRDAETKFTQSGTAVSNFSLATTRKYKKGEEWVEETEWHNCVLWQKEKLAAYITKGTKLFVQGRLKTDSYEKEGQKQYRTQVVVEAVEFGGGNKSNDNGDTDEQPRQSSQSRPNGGGQAKPGFSRGPGQGRQAQPPSAPTGGNYDGMDIDDSDVPF